VHHASRGEPQYIIKSEKTDHVAIHKGQALKHIKTKKKMKPKKTKTRRKHRRGR
jgi:Hypervirulence associated proteins TUDOR domain